MGNTLTNAQPYEIEFFTAPKASTKPPTNHLSEITMHEIHAYDCILAVIHLSEENADDAPSLPPEPLPDIDTCEWC